MDECVPEDVGQHWAVDVPGSEGHLAYYAGTPAEACAETAKNMHVEVESFDAATNLCKFTGGRGQTVARQWCEPPPGTEPTPLSVMVCPVPGQCTLTLQVPRAMGLDDLGVTPQQIGFVWAWGVAAVLGLWLIGYVIGAGITAVRKA